MPEAPLSNSGILAAYRGKDADQCEAVRGGLPHLPLRHHA